MSLDVTVMLWLRMAWGVLTHRLGAGAFPGAGAMVASCRDPHAMVSRKGAFSLQEPERSFHSSSSRSSPSVPPTSAASWLGRIRMIVVT